MDIVSIGGGPAGLYFSILMKKAFPGARLPQNFFGDVLVVVSGSCDMFTLKLRLTLWRSSV